MTPNENKRVINQIKDHGTLKKKLDDISCLEGWSLKLEYDGEYTYDGAHYSPGCVRAIIYKE